LYIFFSLGTFLHGIWFPLDSLYLIIQLIGWELLSNSLDLILSDQLILEEEE